MQRREDEPNDAAARDDRRPRAVQRVRAARPPRSSRRCADGRRPISRARPRTINTIPHVQMSHITRSSAESVVSMRHATSGAGQRDRRRRRRRRRRDARRLASPRVRPLRSTVLDAARQRVAGHAAPTGNAHQRPRRRGASPSVIVGPGDEREVETVGEMDDARAIATRSATVRAANRRRSRSPARRANAAPDRRRHLAQVSGNRLDRRRGVVAGIMFASMNDCSSTSPRSARDDAFVASTRAENVDVLAL